jgi:hypothetical protein
MTTIPRNIDNEYGIIAFDIRLDRVVLDKLPALDRQQADVDFKKKEEGLDGSPVADKNKTK